MDLSTNHISFSIPDGWTVFRDGKQLVVHGPENSEVIATSAVLEITRNAQEINSARIANKDRLVKMMRCNVATHGLKQLTEIIETVGSNGIQIFSIDAESRDCEAAFDQYVLVSESEVLFITYEAPVRASHVREMIRMAIRSARVL